MNKDQDIERLFQSSFEDFEVIPPDQVKSRIDQELLFVERKSFFNKNWFLGSLLVLITLSVSFYIFYENTQQPSRSLAQTDGNKTEDLRQKTKDERQQDFKTSGLQDSGLQDSGLQDSGQKTSGLQDSGLQDSGQKTTAQKTTGQKTTAQKTTGQKTIGQHDFKTAGYHAWRQKEKTGDKKKAKHSKGKGKNSSGKNGIIGNENNLLGNELSQNNSNNQGNANINGQVNSDTDQSTKKNDPENEANTMSTAGDSATKNLNNTTNLAIGNPNTMNNNNGKRIPILLSASGGISLPINNLSQTFAQEKAKENNAFNLQFEATYFLKSNLGASSGFNYYQSSERYSKTVEITIDSIVTGYDYETITIDTFMLEQNDTVIDTVYFTLVDTVSISPIYGSGTAQSTQSTAYVSSSFGIPILLNYTFKLQPKLYLDVLGGGILSYQKIHFRDQTNNPLNDEVVLNQFAFKACLKTHLRYHFNQFGVSLNTNFFYDFGSAKFSNIQRNRYVFDLGIGLHYQF